MNTLEELAALWPRMDDYLRDDLRSFFERLTNSWVNYSGGMTREEKDEFLEGLHNQLRGWVSEMKVLCDDLDESSPSSPRSEGQESRGQELKTLLAETDGALVEGLTRT